MKVLVDTPIWSLSLRRKVRVESEPTRSELAALVQDSRVAIIGPIRQEILSGIKERSQFDRLRDHLRAFVDTQIVAEDYEDAASFFNLCRSRGIQGSNTDFLICAVSKPLRPRASSGKKMHAARRRWLQSPRAVSADCHRDSNSGWWKI